LLRFRGLIPITAPALNLKAGANHSILTALRVVKANRILDLGELLVQQGPYKAIPMGMAPGSLLMMWHSCVFCAFELEQFPSSRL
jgi:hypothetical protein